METIIKQWDNINLIKIFEIPVTSKETGEQDYIIFDIDIANGQFIAQHEPLTLAERNSDKIAFKSINIDPDFSLTENLTELYSECIEAVSESDYFNLSD